MNLKIADHCPGPKSGSKLPHSKRRATFWGRRVFDRIDRMRQGNVSPLARLRPARQVDFFGASATRSPGFTLIEIMVVVVILGILAATIIPKFIGTTHDAKVGTAKATVAELESALERLYIHLDRYPTTEEGLKSLVECPPSEEKKWRGPYISLLRPDPWSNPYEYRFPGVQRKSGFDLWSRGADGADGGEGDGADIGNW